MNKDVKQTETKNILVQAVIRALKILKVIGNSTTPLQIAEISKITGLNRTTVWRLLASLEEEGFVDKDLVTNGYVLGYELYGMTAPGGQYEALKRLARKPLEELQKQVDETVLLSVPKSNGVFTIEQINPDYAVRLIDYTNEISPLHCTSNGKIILSLFSNEELERFLAQPLQQHSKHTILDSKVLKAELADIRKDGVGYTFGELDESENAISAPIFGSDGHLLACVTIGGPSFRLPKEKLFTLKDKILATAHKIEKLLL